MRRLNEGSEGVLAHGRPIRPHAVSRTPARIAPLQDSGSDLTPVETETLKPRIEILIPDERANKSTPLPALPEQDGSVLVRTSFAKPLD